MGIYNEEMYKTWSFLFRSSQLATVVNKIAAAAAAAAAAAKSLSRVWLYAIP